MFCATSPKTRSRSHDDSDEPEAVEEKEEEVVARPLQPALTLAIQANDVDKARTLLAEGHRPEYERILDYVGIRRISSAMVDLLAECDALPAGVSLATLKLTIFASGNTSIQVSEFWDKPDLNINGKVSFTHSPITLLAMRGHYQAVKLFIEEGAQDRPLSYLFLCVHPSHFGRFDHFHIDEFRERIRGNFSSDKFDALEDQCKVAEVLLQNPTSELDVDVTRRPQNLLPLFVWAASNNRSDLFDLPYFVELFRLPRSGDQDEDVITLTIQTAAAFGATEFILRARACGGLNDPTLTAACRVAAADGNTDLLRTLAQLFDQSVADVWSGEITRRRHETPLFWAVRIGHLAVVKFILEMEGDPTKRKDIDDDYLPLAERNKHVDVLQYLLAYRADVRRPRQGYVWESILQKMDDSRQKICEYFNYKDAL